MINFASILGPLANIATYFAIPAISDAIADIRNKKKGVTEVDIANIISGLYNGISNRGSKALTELNIKLNNLPIANSSGPVKDMIQKKRRELTRQISDVEQKMSEINTEAQGVERRANSLSMMSNSYKRSESGQKDLEKIKNDAQSLIIKASDIDKPIQGENK